MLIGGAAAAVDVLLQHVLILFGFCDKLSVGAAWLFLTVYLRERYTGSAAAKLEPKTRYHRVCPLLTRSQTPEPRA